MAKRRLTNKQERQIAQNQQDILTEDAGNSLDLTNTQKGQVISHFGKQLIVEAVDKIQYQCKLRQNLGSITCGDNILFQLDESGD